MAVDQDYDSDEIEIPEQPASRWAAAGARSIESMVLSAADDRMSSKISVKTLQYTASPTAEYMRAKWGNQFEAFRAGTLGKAPNSVPDAEQVERFIVTMPSHMHGKSGKDQSTVHYSTMVGALTQVLAHCRWKYEGFQFPKQAAQRLGSSLKAMVRQGKLTRQSAKERVWLQHNILAKMLRALLSESLDKGALCWDYVLNRALGLSLETALGCRPGDVALSARYDDECCLRWKHINMVLTVGADGQTTFSTLLTLCYIKGTKERTDDSTQVLLQQLPGSETNVLCAVSYLIIQALRVGAVAETSYAELINRYATQPGRPVVWARPEAPVLCSSKGRMQLLLDRPAQVKMLLDTLVHAGQLVGLLHQLQSHAIRRGAAAEAAHLGSSVQYSEILAQRTMNHSNRTANAGTTREKYIGPLRVDVYAERVKAGPLNGSDHMIQLADTGYRAPSRIPTQDVTDYCVGKGTDPEDVNDRKSAARFLRMEHAQAWRESQKNMLGAARSEQAAHASLGTTGAVNGEPAGPSTSPRPLPRHGGSATVSPSARPLPPKPEALPRSDDAAGDFDYSLVDPALQDPALTSALNDLVHDDKTLLPALGLAPEPDQGPDHSQEQEQEQEQEGQDAITDAANPSDIFAADRSEFIDFFSKINIVRTTTTPSSVRAWEIAHETYPRGSLDPPSRFAMVCPNSIFGCPAVCYSDDRLQHHIATCQFVDEDYVKAHPHRCIAEGCSKAFTSASALRHHVLGVHEWTPRACAQVDCDSTELFYSHVALQEHIHSEHNPLVPQRCAVRDCPNPKVYDRVSSYRAHLKRKHPELSAEGIAELLPPAKKHRASQADRSRPAELQNAEFSPQRCSHPGCPWKRVFASIGNYLHHLGLSHGVFDHADQVLFVLSAADLEKE